VRFEVRLDCAELSALVFHANDTFGKLAVHSLLLQ